MDLVSVCALRAAATLTRRGSTAELRVVVKATFEPTPSTIESGRPSVELAQHQPIPEGHERWFVDEQAPRASRRLAGVERAPRCYAFEGAPHGLGEQTLPAALPRLFISHANGVEEAMLSVALVELNPMTGWVTVLWVGAAQLSTAGLAARAVVALETPPDLMTWQAVLDRTNGLDTAFVQQAARIVERDAPNLGGPIEAERRSIGQRLADRPGPTRAPASMTESAEPRVAPGPSPWVEGFETLWVSESAPAAVRKHPTLRKLLPKRDREEDDDGVELREVGAAAVRAEPTPLEDLRSVLRRAASQGVLEAPLVVVGGTIAFALSPLRRLEAWCEASEALAPNDEGTQAALKSARATLNEQREIAFLLADTELARLRASLEKALGPTSRLASELDELVDGALGRERAFERVALGQGERALASLSGVSANVDGGGRPVEISVPLLVPAEALSKLPLFRRWEARVIGRLAPNPTPLHRGRGAASPKVAIFPLAIVRAFRLARDRQSADARSVTT